VVLGLVVVFGLVSARLFVWPPQGRPTPADAIVVLGGDGGRFDAGARLALDGFAPVMVVSSDRNSGTCPGTLPTIELICFGPDPFTTRGEARYVADLAAARGWQHVIVVTSTAQGPRARLRIERCYHDRFEIQTVRPDARRMVRDVFYEWGALAKALTVERGC
jgi:uncharacterized SAM-binding protein YcdF (DUF218 family)